MSDLLPEAEIEKMRTLMVEAEASQGVQEPGTAVIDDITPAGYALLMAAPDFLEALFKERAERVEREEGAVLALSRVALCPEDLGFSELQEIAQVALAELGV